MREFMAKVRDRLSERWNDPERQEDRLAVVIVGATAAVVIIALLIVLWGYLTREHGQEAADNVSGNALQTAAYEEKMREYMAQNEGQAAQWRECAAIVEKLNEEVKELLEAMTKTEQGLTEAIAQYQEGDTLIQKELTAVHIQADSVVQELKETQTQLYDLTDIVQVMNEETVPMILQQLAQLESDMERTQEDIADLYARIDALTKEDSKLWKSIGDVRNTLVSVKNVIIDAMQEEDGKLWDGIEDLRNTLENVASGINDTMQEEDGKLWGGIEDLRGSLGDVESSINDTLQKENSKLWESIEELRNTLRDVESVIGEMHVQTLRYRYDENSRTLYLDPYQD